MAFILMATMTEELVVLVSDASCLVAASCTSMTCLITFVLVASDSV